MTRKKRSRRLDSKYSEKDFQRDVIKLCDMYGWLQYHTYDSRMCVAGFPDLVIVKNGRVIFAELKTAIGRVTGAQEMWIYELLQCKGIEVYVWRPNDMQSIADILGQA